MSLASTNNIDLLSLIHTLKSYAIYARTFVKYVLLPLLEFVVCNSELADLAAASNYMSSGTRDSIVLVLMHFSSGN
jgi:hypothetical protein